VEIIWTGSSSSPARKKISPLNLTKKSF